MTFAYHVPADYSLEAFRAGTLDYAEGASLPVEIWGRPENTIAALEQHNDAVRELASQHPEVVFIDQERLMPRSGKHFLDCCHFTPEGCTVFTEHLLARLAPSRER
jgi:hypothetical protein